MSEIARSNDSYGLYGVDKEMMDGKPGVSRTVIQDNSQRPVEEKRGS